MRYRILLVALTVALMLSTAPIGPSAFAAQPAGDLPCVAVLARSANGADALRLLAGRIDDVARQNGMTGQQLRDILLADLTLWIDPCGQAFYVDPPQPASGPEVAALSFPESQTFLLHSRPGANRVIYLDFNGELISGTAWNDTDNGGADFYAPPYDDDGSPTTFSSDELAVVQSVWQRVAEDFAPFEVDVTTEDPGIAALERSSFSDTVFGARALITNDTLIYNACECGGIAYVGVFDSYGNDLYYQPAFVFTNGVGWGAKNIAEAASHEVGHNLALNHDGTSTQGYYTGHGSWAPIMGVGYYEPITQWSRGEYAGANNSQDDVSTINNRGAPLRADDVPNSRTSAIALGPGASLTAAGVIGGQTDVDWFSFSGSGQTTIAALPAPVSPNLDIQLQLYNSGGTLLASANPSASQASGDVANGLNASISTTLPSSGTYYVMIDGVGFGSPASTGYSDYGSLGQYSLTITTVVGAPPTPNPTTPANGTAFNPDGFDGTFSWTTVSGATVYLLEATGGPLGLFSSGWQAGTSWTAPASAIADGYAYSWQVKARNGSGESPWSATSTFSISLVPPQSLQFVGAAECDQVEVAWQSYATTWQQRTGGEGIRVYRNGAPLVDLGPDEASYVDTSVLPETTYTYSVTAFRGSVESDQATIQIAPTSVMTPSCPATMAVTDVTLTATSSTAPADLSGQVVVESAGNGVNGAAVTIEWTNPDGSTGSATSTTDLNGVASFTRSANQAGSHTLTVTDVALNGLVYEPEENLESSASVTLDGAITVDSTSGSPGTVLTVGVAGFGASEQVRFEFVDSLGNAEGITTVTALATGERTVQFGVPQTPRGDYLIRATGLAGGLVLDAPYTVTPSIAHPSTIGNPGNLVTFTFKGYLAGESIDVVFVHGFGAADEVIGMVAAGLDGTAVITVEMPSAGRGFHTIRGVGDGGTTTQSTWEVIPRQILNRYFGPVGRTIEMTLDGWARNTEITVRWYATTSTGSPSVVLGTIMTDNVGYATYFWNVPEAAGDSHRLEVLGGGNVRHVYFYVQTSLELSTLVGPPGASVDANVRGFRAGEQVEIRFYTTSVDYVVLETVSTNAIGSVDTTLVLPNSTRGTHRLRAVGLTSGLQAQRWIYLAA